MRSLPSLAVYRKLKLHCLPHHVLCAHRNEISVIFQRDLSLARYIWLAITHTRLPKIKYIALWSSCGKYERK